VNFGYHFRLFPGEDLELWAGLKDWPPSLIAFGNLKLSVYPSLKKRPFHILGGYPGFVAPKSRDEHPNLPRGDKSTAPLYGVFHPFWEPPRCVDTRFEKLSWPNKIEL